MSNGSPTLGSDHGTAEDFDHLAKALMNVGLGPNCVFKETVDSTNRLARRVAEKIYLGGDTPKTTWFIGYGQTAGRGRYQRKWLSSPGSGIYVSLLLPIPGPPDPDRLLSLPLAVGVSACAALRDCSGTTKIGLKWPNDLFAGGRKLGGILIEVVEGRPEHRCAIIGIGINHRQGCDALPHENATSLRLLAEQSHRKFPGLADYVLALCAGVHEEVARERRLEDILRDYQHYSVHSPGDRLAWTSSKGPVQGVFEGFDGQGCILLRTEAGRIKISAGDIFTPTVSTEQTNQSGPTHA